MVPVGGGPAWGAADRRVAELRAQAALLVETVENRAAQARRAVPCVSLCGPAGGNAWRAVLRQRSAHCNSAPVCVLVGRRSCACDVFVVAAWLQRV